jgi:negative regulator of sigma E activity
MNDALKMQISAFVDGELPDNESELLLRRLSQDAAVRQQVARYLAMGRLIRQDQEVPGMDRLRGRIAAALGDEALPERAQAEVVGSGLMTPATGIAVAATVAVVALIGLSQVGTPVDTGVQNAVAVDLGAAYTEPTIEQVMANQPSERLREMLRRHGDSSPDLGSGDILYRMATFEVREEELDKIPPDPHLVSPQKGPDAEEQAASQL